MVEKQVSTLLLVDDEPDSMAVLHETLTLIEGHTFRYLFANSAAVASAYLRDEHVDAVIADILMPEVSGLELLQKCNELGIYVPFIFVTSLQSRDAAIHALRLGAFDFIEKPVSTTALEEPLNKALRVSRAFQNLGHEMDQTLIPGRSQSNLRQAVFEIMKLRAMRFQKRGK